MLFRSHTRTASKTDFILPPDHVERERRGSVKNNNSSVNGGGLHKRGHSRGDSLGQYFRDIAEKRGHTRQASRTDSIYTIRQTQPNVSKLDWFRRKKLEDAPPVDRKGRTVVPNHLIPSGIDQSEYGMSEY